MSNLSIVLSIILITTIHAYSQVTTTFVNKQKKIEAGLGIGLFLSEENINFYRLQINKRDLFLIDWAYIILWNCRILAQSILPI
tara:strand:- start:58 stop:309 length:252 start_codon:yes stop_codon:yes gene_type:complete